MHLFPLQRSSQESRIKRRTSLKSMSSNCHDRPPFVIPAATTIRASSWKVTGCYDNRNASCQISWDKSGASPKASVNTSTIYITFLYPADWTSGKMRDRRSLGQGINSCLRHDFFHIAICLQSDSNPSRSKGENISDQSSLEVSMGHGKKRVKGSIPAQRHRKKEAC